MASFSSNPDRNLNRLSLEFDGDAELIRVADRLSKTMERDVLVQHTTDTLRSMLEVNRVVLYYFYRDWKGQVTFESLSSKEFSILGSTGADECFNDEYAALYLSGRARAISDIETEPIHPCHRDFLRSIKVRANLVVPILTSIRLWGLLAAHHCESARPWLAPEIEMMKQAAKTLATSKSICNS